MLKEDSLRKADIFTGFIMILSGGAVIWGASQMPMGGSYGGVDNPWYASPASFPLFLGALLALGGAMVAAKGLKAVGAGGLSTFLVKVLKAPVQRPSARRGVIVAVALGCYYTLLQLHLFASANYVVSSAIFLATMAIFFYRPSGEKPGVRMIIAICLAAALISATVAALFSGPLRVPLP